MAIDYQAIAKAGGIAKGEPRKKTKARRDRADAKALKDFRDAVWEREAQQGYDSNEFCICEYCGAWVSRGPDVELTGEVHHRIFRGNKATRYDPDNGVLLCNHLVNNCHEKAKRKLITV